MARWIVGITVLTMLSVFAARDARAQAAASWPSVGTLLTRVEDPSRPAASDIADGACATLLRDSLTRREYVLRHSVVKTSVAQHQSGATTNTSTRLLRAVGDYARVESKGDTPSTRVVSVDCLTSRVVTRRAGT